MDDDTPMVVGIGTDEKYPVYFLTTDANQQDVITSVPLSTLKRWSRIQSEYDQMQREMQDAV